MKIIHTKDPIFKTKYTTNTYTEQCILVQTSCVMQYKEFLYQLIYIFSCGTHLLHRVIISVFFEKRYVYFKELIYHPFGDT
jgi:hypothetical protein